MAAKSEIKKASASTSVYYLVAISCTLFKSLSRSVNPTSESTQTTKLSAFKSKYTTGPLKILVDKDFSDKEGIRKIKELSLVGRNFGRLKGKCPRQNQLIAVLQYLNMDNLLLQAGTGQGKTQIVGMFIVVMQNYFQTILST